MATSGTRLFTPQFADMLTHAFGNCGIRPANVTQEHIDEAIRSANLMLISFGNMGVQQYQLIEFATDTASGTASYALPAGTRDVWHAVYRRDGSDTPIWPMARADYHSIPDKTTVGRPFNYTVDIEKIGDAGRSITVWPVPDGTDELRMWLWVEPESPTRMSQTLSVAKAWYDAYGWDLSWRMAVKYAPDRLDFLQRQAGASIVLARQASRERRDLRLRARGGGSAGRIV